MNIKIIAFLLVASFGKVATAQSYIEVTVHDTVMLKPDYYLYSFIVNNYSTDVISDDSSDKKETGAQRLEKKFTSVIRELKKNNFNIYSNTLADSLTIYPATSGILQSATLIMYHADSLKLASTILKKHEDITAYVQTRRTVTAEDEKRMYKKILETARRQADHIASLAGRKIKQIESVTEKEDETGYTSYPPLSSLEGSVIPGWHTTIGTPSFASTSKEIFHPVGSAFTVRFSLQ